MNKAADLNTIEFGGFLPFILKPQGIISGYTCPFRAGQPGGPWPGTIGGVPVPAQYEVRAVLGPAGRPTVTARARPGKCGRPGIGPVYIPTLPSPRNPSHSPESGDGRRRATIDAF